jgi:hypothetical protein
VDWLRSMVNVPPFSRRRSVVTHTLGTRVK